MLSRPSTAPALAMPAGKGGRNMPSRRVGALLGLLLIGIAGLGTAWAEDPAPPEPLWELGIGGFV